MNNEESGKKQRRSRAEAAQIAGESSGLSRRDFCKQRGLSINTLNRYCERRRASTEAGADRWIEVEISASGARVKVLMVGRVCRGFLRFRRTS